jgi:hypothetical protein
MLSILESPGRPVSQPPPVCGLECDSTSLATVRRLHSTSSPPLSNTDEACDEICLGLNESGSKKPAFQLDSTSTVCSDVNRNPIAILLSSFRLEARIVSAFLAPLHIQEASTLSSTNELTECIDWCRVL